MNNYFSLVIQYLISPSIIAIVIGFVMSKVYKLGEFNEKFNTVLKKVSKLEKDFSGFKHDLIVIKSYLVSNFGIDANLFITKSPFKLLPKGEMILNQSNFEEIYKNNKNLFLDQIRNLNAKTEADIDEASIKVLEKNKSDKLFKSFKTIAYKNGITIDVLLKICSIYLRDQAIKEILNK